MSDAFARLPTPFKILLILTLALLPIGLASVWATARGFDTARRVATANERAMAEAAAARIENAFARNSLAVRSAANAILGSAEPEPCAAVQRALGVAPAVGREFSLLDAEGRLLCAVGDMGPPPPPAPLAPGDYRVWPSPALDSVLVRGGVMAGSSVVKIRSSDLASELTATIPNIRGAALVIDNQRIEVIKAPTGPRFNTVTQPVMSDRLTGQFAVFRPGIGTVEQLFLFLPLLMWFAAGMISWWMVHRLLIKPLRRLESAVVDYDPEHEPEFALPPGLGPAREIHQLGEAFQRGFARLEHAERDTRDALEGQRKLLREVHHRVKNNLQVVASLLSIHGRTAADSQAQAAYSAIGRRVDALAVVHRNHYAELEENRGIALRPLLTELAASLRASTPTNARKMHIDLDVASTWTTQDVAVAAAFIITEIVEYAMLRRPEDAIEISLRRTSELTACLTMTSNVLSAEDEDEDPARKQFERIVEGLARQLRSQLERKLGRYSVTLPVFPEN
jgi:two-component sensor histidine kinase